jgi:hypothetical protein
LIETIKSNKKTEIVALIDNILAKPLMFYKDSQKVEFLRKVKYLSEIYADMSTKSMMNKYLNTLLNSLSYKSN